jgi:capsular exopolysaccharide synthesis family protein
MSDQTFVELRWIYSVIRRAWWMIIGLALLAGVGAYIATSMMSPVYKSSAMLLVTPSKNSNTSQYNDLMAGTQLALTYSQMLKDRTVLEKVISELALKQSPDGLAEQITAEPVRSSQIIKLTIEDSNPKQAALIANSLAHAFTQRVEELSAQRYAGTIKNAQDRMVDLQSQMQVLQAQMDSLRSQKVTGDVALANKQTLLTTLQSEYLSIQNTFQAMQLTVADVTGKVYIVEPVQYQKVNLAVPSFASVVVSIGPVQSTGGDSFADERLVLTYGQLIIKPPLLQGVIKELSLQEKPDQLSKKISYELVTGTQLIRFKVEDPDESKAQLIAQSLANAFVAHVKAMLAEPYSSRLENMQQQITAAEESINKAQIEIGALTSETAKMASELDRLDTDLTAVRSDYRESQRIYEQLQTTAAETANAVVITEPAQAPKLPTQNNILYIVVAVFLGLAVGTGFAFLLKYIDGQIRSDQDVFSALNLPVLSTVGQLARKENDLVMASAPASLISEDFRVLGNKIRLISKNTSVKTLLITSPVPTEGKSIIVSNLAIGLSRMGLRVVLVDADLRLPRLHNLFGLPQDAGLTDSLSIGNINGTLQSTGIGELQILTSGRKLSNPAEVLSSPSLANLLQELKDKVDLVLIDCPPVLAASDASILASKVDGVLLVLRAGHSESGPAQEAIETLRQVKANVVGIVLNSVPARKRGYGYYH